MVVAITAVLRWIIPGRVFWEYCLTLSWGERINLEEAVELMLDQGHVAAMRQIALTHKSILESNGEVTDNVLEVLFRGVPFLLSTSLLMALMLTAIKNRWLKRWRPNVYRILGNPRTSSNDCIRCEEGF